MRTPIYIVIALIMGCHAPISEEGDVESAIHRGVQEEVQTPGESATSSTANHASVGPTLGALALVSLSTTGQTGNSNSYSPTVSGDGRLVAFVSAADNLVPGDTNGEPDIFVRDLVSHVTARVSVTSSGAECSGNSEWPTISADGRYIAFASDARDLVQGDTNEARDIFVHDRQARTTTRVSVADDGSQASHASNFPQIASGGSHVAFVSDAHNLVADDTNGLSDVFVHDIVSSSTSRINVSSTGSQANGPSHYRPAITAKGRFVVFTSAASNLVGSDGNNAPDAFIRDRSSSTTFMVPYGAGESADGEQWGGLTAASANGQCVLLGSDSYSIAGALLWDRETGDTTPLLSAANPSTDDFSVSANCRIVAYSDISHRTMDADTLLFDVFVAQRGNRGSARPYARVGDRLTNGSSYQPQVSDDGCTVAFASQASNLVPDDNNGTTDVFVFDLCE